MGSTLKIIGLFLMTVLIISAVTFGLLQGSSSASARSVEEIEGIVKNYIIENPEIIIQALTEHQLRTEKQEQANSREAIMANRDALENDPDTPFMGSETPDVTIVEFFDYSCGYCKKVRPYLAQLLKEDKNLKIAFKEFPILGANSTLASQAAIAVNMIDSSKYFAFHNELMKKRVSSRDGILKIVTEVGLDKDAVARKMSSPEVEAVIQKNRQLASKLGIRGTPAFTINGEFVPGAIDYDGFKSYIKSARQK